MNDFNRLWLYFSVFRPTKRQFIRLVICAFLALVYYFLWSGNYFFHKTPENKSRLGYCSDENMMFPSYKEGRLVRRGEMFDCSFLSMLMEKGLTDSDNYQRKPIVPSDVVFVMYASSNHFTEAREAIRMLRLLRNNKIVFYDLGLEPSEVADIKKVCKLEVIKLDYIRYPFFVTNLLTYSFKPILMADAFSRYDAFWIIDASTRFFNGTALQAFYQNINDHPDSMPSFLAEHPSGHTCSEATQNGTFNYFPISPELADLPMMQALTMFVVKANFSREVIKWNLLCALTEQCIAPTGSSIVCGGGVPGCHRFDQSSVNLVLYSLRERDHWSRPLRSVQTGAFSPFVTESRDTIYTGPLPTKC